MSHLTLVPDEKQSGEINAPARHTKKTKALWRMHHVYLKHIGHTVNFRHGKNAGTGVVVAIETDYGPMHCLYIYVRVKGQLELEKLFYDEMKGCSCGG